MKSRVSKISFIAVMVFVFCMLLSGTPAQAALSPTFGPPIVGNPGTQGMPSWYQDLNGVSLGPCWDFNGFCTLLPPFCPASLGLGCVGTTMNLDSAIPITPANFPIETFYFDATTVMSFGVNLKAKLTQVLALEGSFGGLPAVVAPGGQITFLRINVRVVAAAGELVPNSLYTVVHPYGTYTFNTDPTGIPIKVGGAGVNRAVDGCAASPCDFSLLTPATTTNIGPWLIDAAGLHTTAAVGAAGTGPGGNGAAPAGSVYIGPGPLSAVPVTGSPVGTNFVSVTGPCANGGGAACLAAPVTSTFTDNVFFLGGKVVGITANPSNVVFPVQKAGPPASAVTTVTITNPDSINAATLGGVAPAVPTGANAADFIITADGCSGATLAAGGGSCSFGVSFLEPVPGTNGNKSALLTFAVTAPANKPPVLVNLSGSIDNIPPKLLSTIPVNNDINIPANNVLIATFSEPVTGVSLTTFSLSGGSPVSAVTCTVGLDSTGTVATLYPVANLQADKPYTATITNGITDLVGNPLGQTFTINFTTTAAATDPPSVIDTTPKDNVTGVKVADPITVTFNTAIQVNPVSITPTTFFLSEGLTGSVSYDQATRTATLQPNRQLDYFHAYTVTVTKGVKSLGGIPMAADFTFKFFTNGAPNAPQLYLPTDGEKVAGPTVNLQWFKAKDIDNEPVNYHVWYCNNPGYLGCKPVDVSVTATTASAAPQSGATPLAAMGGYGAGMLLAGFAFMGGVKSRKKMFFLIAVVLLSGMAVTACHKSSSSDNTVDPALLASKSVTVQSGTTYYWKVVADDGNGALIESETRAFVTQ